MQFVFSTRYWGRVLQRGRHDNHLAKGSGKFSIRLVPPQTPENADTLVIKYDLSAEFVKRKSAINAENLHGGKPGLRTLSTGTTRLHTVQQLKRTLAARTNSKFVPILSSTKPFTSKK
jgi:hypothetical protein